MLYSVSQCTCNISPWAIIVLPDTVTLISTSSLLSAVFPSVWPVSANTVLESVCACVCMCVHCVLSGLFPGLWTCIETQRGLATATNLCQWDRKEPHCWRIRVEMRGISLPGQATKPNCSWSTGAIQVPVGYIHLAWLSISLFPLENCSQPNMFVRAGVETKVKSQHVCKLSWPEWNLWKTFCVCKSSLISDMMKIYLLKKKHF